MTDNKKTDGSAGLEAPVELSTPADFIGENSTSNATTQRLARRRVSPVLGAIVLLLVVTPLVFTLIGAATSPSRVEHIPEGHLLYLEGDEPSEHTATLRGLFLVDTSGRRRLLAHDFEDQDEDSGARTWIDEPSVSPDGKWMAYLQDNIVLLDEKQGSTQELVIAPTVASGGKSIQVQLTTEADMPNQAPTFAGTGIKHYVGVYWMPDGKRLALLQDNALIIYAPFGTRAAKSSRFPLSNLPNLATNPYVNALGFPDMSSAGALTCIAQTANGPELIGSGRPVDQTPPTRTGQTWPLQVYDARAYGLSPDGTEAAVAPTGRSHEIRIVDTATGQVLRTVSARWGWSFFGGRQITSVGFSPDGNYLAYTVSKPPVPEEELFVMNLSSGEIHLLPYRTGQAAWTWIR